MIRVLNVADRDSLSQFEAIIDVRSPAEFAEDHIFRAENLPVLDDVERANVGTLYAQESKFKARRVGAAYVARNLATHLETALQNKPIDYAPLIYCWRGGQRSAAMATVLDQVGWRVTLLDGGYRTYRRRVTAALYDAEPRLKLVLLDGDTGSAKTEILHRLQGRGVQVLDLEGLAGHRGSLFGGVAGRPQPSQKLFESRLLAALERLDPSRAIIVEAESSRIGDCFVPPMLWKCMLVAPRVELSAPAAVRASYLVRTYGEMRADPTGLQSTLGRLPGRHSRDRRESWCALARIGAFEALAEALIESHYDPAYQQSRRRDGRSTLGVVRIDNLDDASQGAAVDRLVDLLAMHVPDP